MNAKTTTYRSLGSVAVLCKIAAALSLATTVLGQTPNLKTLPGHVPKITASLQPTGRLPADRPMRLTIALPLRDKQGLSDFIQEIYDPKSPAYHHYLTAEQFAGRFGPTEQDYQTVSNFVSASNLKISGTYKNRLIMDVEGNASDIENAFHVYLLTFQHPTEAREFYAPDSEPSVDQSIPILEIEGLSDYSTPQPLVRPHPDSLISSAGSGPDGYLLGKDFRNAYVPGVSLTGTGQTVGLMELDGYYASDITAYENLAGLKAVTLQNVLVDGYGGGIQSPNGNLEVSLDIEMAIAMAPGLSKIVVFETYAKTNDWLDILNTMVSHTNINQFSTSWSYTGGPNASTDNILQEMAAQGQSFFVAAGDSEAYLDGETIPVPCDSPYSTSVGGTTLTMNGSGASYNSETVWNWGYDANENAYVGGSGGISSYYSIPSWQDGLATSENQGSTTQRMIPDVALTANQIWVTYGDGSSTWVGGTSCAAPLWAAFMALVNQEGAFAGLPPAGFVNPAIYALGSGTMTNTTYSSCFNDITTGTNEWPSSPSQFSATTGYDLCTGWGTPAGSNLVTYLSTSSVQPVTLYTFTNIVDGQSPVSTLVSSGDTLYGVTGAGGAYSNGAIFSIKTNGSNFQTLYSFTGLDDGSSPNGGLILSGGTLYGTAAYGGSAAGLYGNGVVFSLRTNGTDFKVICTFTNSGAGYTPIGSLVLSDGTLYGNTFFGNSLPWGSVFSVATNGTHYKTLYSFTNGSDGGGPEGGLVLSGSTLYGVCPFGGDTTNNIEGAGIIFSVSTSGTSFKTIYTFTGLADGDGPEVTMTLSGSTLYGATEYGGGPSGQDDGTIFSIGTSGHDFSVLHTFDADYDWYGTPISSLTLHNGTLYGTESTILSGQVFALATNGSLFVPICIFPDTTNVIEQQPFGSRLLYTSNQVPTGVIFSGDTLYGTTLQGGAGLGTVFSLP